MRWRLLSGLLLLTIACTPITEKTIPGSDRTSTPDEESTPETFTDGGLISEIPCGPPCFYGIAPGVTTEQEALIIINQNPGFQPCDEKRNTEEIDLVRRTLLCSYFDIYFNDGIVQGVKYSLQIPVTVRELIERFGNPDAVMVRITGLPDQDSIAYMDLYFDDLSTHISLSNQVSDYYYIVDENTKVGNVSCHSKSGYDDLISMPYFTNWNGYGEYTDTIP